MRSIPLLFLTAWCLTGCESPPAGEPIPVPPAGTDTSVSVPASGEPDPPAPTNTSSNPDTPSEANVALTEPLSGSTVRANPFVIRGRARTFENNVEIEIENAAGQTMRQTFATARGELGSFNPFEKTVFLTHDPGAEMTITLIERSMKDGSVRSRDSARVRVDIARRPVKLYFPNQNSDPNDCTAVEPVVRNLPVSVSAARLTLEALIGGPTRAERVIGANNPFPDATEIRSVNLRNRTLTVDFGERLVNVGGSCRALAIRAALERTLESLEGVDRVVITAMGREDQALQP